MYFFTATATTEIYTLSLHDALPIYGENIAAGELERRGYEILARRYRTRHGEIDIVASDEGTIVFVEVKARATAEFGTARSEEHTSELQSRLHLVCRLLLEKKKKKIQ